MIIFVGEVTNPPGLEPRLALTGSSGQRLARLAGVHFPAYLRMTRLNIDPSGTSDRATRAATARMIEDHWGSGDCIVMLGQEVQKAFGFKAELPPYDRVLGASGVTLVAFPHPSGRNHYWNDPDNEATAARHLQDLIREFGKETTE